MAPKRVVRDLQADLARERTLNMTLLNMMAELVHTRQWIVTVLFPPPPSSDWLIIWRVHRSIG